MNDPHAHNRIAEKQSISDSVLSAIRADEVKMRPKWYFALHGGLLVTGTALASLTVLYLASFIVFSLRQNGSWFVTSFGAEGWRAFFASMPWLLIVVSLLFITILGILVKKYSFAYARPLLYSAVGIILFAGVGGFLLALTPLHSGLFGQAVEYRLPVAGGIYREYGGHPVGKVITGIIIEMNENGYTIFDQDKEVLFVVVTPYTKLPPKLPELRDIIVVLGDRRGNIVEARGIQCLSGHRGLRPMQPAPFSEEVPVPLPMK